MTSHARDHPLLRSIHAAMQMHRAHSAQHSHSQDDRTADDATTAAAAADRSTAHDTRCPRCSALAAATAASASASAVPAADSQWPRLYRDALAITPPFATLSPNQSQRAAFGEPQLPASGEETNAVPDAAAAASVTAASSVSPASAAAASAPLAPDSDAALSLSELLTPAGFLRWEAFASAASAAPTAAAAASSASSASFSPMSPCAESIYALSCPRLIAACQCLHAYLRRLDPAEFRARYTEVQGASNHGSTLAELFEMYKHGCTEHEGDENASVDAASASSSSLESLGAVAGDGEGMRRPSVCLVLMVVSSHTERVLGDVFLARRRSPSSPVPRMLRDLLASEEIASALPAPALHLIQALIGSPRALNLRNILWHGFLPLVDRETNAAIDKFAAATLLLHISILKECTDKIWPPSPSLLSPPSPSLSHAVTVTAGAEQDGKEDAAPSAVAVAPPPVVKIAPRRPLKHKFPGDAALKAHLSSALFAPAAAAASPVSVAALAVASSSSSPSSAASPPNADSSSSPFDSWPIPPSLVWGASSAAFARLTSDLRALLASSYFLPHHRVHDLMYAWELLEHKPYLALCVLMPVVESVARHWFVYANAQCPGVGDAGDFAENDRIEAGLLLAQSERLFTTMDVVLGARIDPLDAAASSDADALGASPSPPPPPQVKCDRASAFAFPLVASACSFPSAPSPQHNALYRPSLPDLPALPGAGLMLALWELLISRVGPRLRDRVAHGEITWGDAEGANNKTLEPWLVLYAFNIVIAMAVQFPLCVHAAATAGSASSSPPPATPSPQLPASFSTPMAFRARSWLSNYIPVGHARSITFQRVCEATRGMLRIQNHLAAWDQRVAQDRAGSHDELSILVASDADEGLSLRAPVRAWYGLVFTSSSDFIQRRLRILESECVAHQGAGLEAMALWANRLAVQAGVLLQSMRREESGMPLWASMPSWLFGCTAADQSQSAVPQWWTLWHDPFWSRSHRRFHHDAAGQNAACSLSCLVHCHDHCMSHAPILALERMFDTMPALLAAFDSSYVALQEVAAGPAAPSAKRKLAEHVQEALPALIACAATTVVALALLWEHMQSKAHDPMFAAASAAASCSSAAVPSSSSSASPSPSSDLLRRDRSIARLLKKSSGALDRVRLLYAANRWLPAMHEWAIVLQAIQEWIEVGWA